MSASLLEVLAVGTLLVLLAGTTAIAVGGYLAWRVLRRRYRSFRSHGAVLGATALWQAASSTRWGRGDVPPNAVELAASTSGQVRRILWRGVDAAVAAVRTADDVGAVVADLPGLSHRLETAALDLDKVLRIDPAGRVAAPVAEQVAEILRAAADIRGAAQLSAGDVAGERVRNLTADAAHELHLLDVGLASMRETGSAAMPNSAPQASYELASLPVLPEPPR